MAAEIALAAALAGTPGSGISVDARLCAEPCAASLADTGVAKREPDAGREASAIMASVPAERSTDARGGVCMYMSMGTGIGASRGCAESLRRVDGEENAIMGTEAPICAAGTIGPGASMGALVVAVAA